MDLNENQDFEKARGAIYGFFSAIFKRPLTPEELGRVMDEEAISALESLFRGRRTRLMKRLEKAGESIEEIQMDYEGLFRVPGEQFVHPFESAYRTPAGLNDAKTRPVMDVTLTKRVMEVYASEGLEPTAEFDDSADHIATELEFMAYLCRRRASRLANGDKKAARHYETKQMDFLKEHLGCWAEPCLKKIEENASTPFYRVFAEFLQAFLEDETGGRIAGSN